MEFECDENISFLNILSSPRNGAIAVDVYRKPLTQTLILILIMTVNIRPEQQELFCTEPYIYPIPPKEKWELSRVCAALKSNGYPSTFIQSLTNVSPEELLKLFFKMVESTESYKSFASLRYIKGVTKPFKRLLKNRQVTTVDTLQ